MNNEDFTLIPMTEIAGLAGETRATVGNWKVRDASFPSQRGKNSRGPLYDRTEVIQWLQSKGRLSESANVNSLTPLIPLLESSNSFGLENSLILILLSAAVRSSIGDEAWTAFLQLPTEQQKKELVRYASEFTGSIENGSFKFLQTDFDLEVFLTIVSAIPAKEIAVSIDVVIEQFSGLPRSRVITNTPDSIKELITGLIGEQESIYCPCSGDGSLLLSLAQVAPEAALFGQEIHPTSCVLTILRGIAQGIKMEIKCGDVFTNDYFPSLHADLVIAIPPFGARLHGENFEMSANDPRWIWGVPGPTGSNVAWIQHCIYHLSDGGRAILVLPQAVLFEGGKSQKIREGIIKSGHLDAVISLPPGLNPFSPVSSAVLIFKKTTQIVETDSPQTVMINLEGLQISPRRRGYLSQDEIKLATNAFHAWRNGSVLESKDVRTVSFREIAENDFNISPKRYIKPSLNTISKKDLGARLKDARSKAEAALAASSNADQSIKNLLGEGN